MTAIAGIWTYDTGGDCKQRCERMLQAQQVYAPERPQVWDGECVAVGRRLFRSLPEDRFDRAPIVGGAGVLVADIRLDNRDELGAALSISTAELRECSDSELLMRALAAWGERAVHRLIGDFAFAWWDQRSQHLLLARDFLGQRPLHYHLGRGFFAFASMPKGLHALPEVPLALDANAMAAFVALLPETGRETYFEGIEKVQPGHIVRVTPDGVRTTQYWQAPGEMLRLKDAREYEDAVRAELDRAVACRLRGTNGRVGAHLSGGLDSTAVAATAARQLGAAGAVVAYTAVPREGYVGGLRNSITNEGPQATAVAALYPNMEHVTVCSSGHSPLERLDTYFHVFERPMLNLCNGVWATAILDDARAKGLEVMLTGDAGNMSISYNGLAALPHMLREGRWLKFTQVAASLIRHGTGLRTVAAQAIGPFLPHPVWRAIAQFRGKGGQLTDYTAINPARLRDLGLLAAQRGLDISYRPRSDPHELRTVALGRIDRGNYNKGFLAGWGIDVRDPSADQRLVELCLAIPPEEYLAGGIPRSLARRAFADRLPSRVNGELKKGYQAADWHEALTRARQDIHREVSRCANIAPARGILSIDKMQALISDWPEDGWGKDEIIESYRLALLRGTSAAHFIRKVSGSNA